jgi:hypothetical protein
MNISGKQQKNFIQTCCAHVMCVRHNLNQSFVVTMTYDRSETYLISYHLDATPSHSGQ